MDYLNQFDHKLNIENYLYKIKHQKNIEKWIILRKNLKKHPFEDDIFNNDIKMLKIKKKVTINEQANTIKVYSDEFNEDNLVYLDCANGLLRCLIEIYFNQIKNYQIH